MLQLRPSCENCDKSLPNESNEAMICAYECTFCIDCVQKILFNVCPNCGGGFEKRPTRPKQYITKHPMQITKTVKPVQMSEFLPLRQKNKDTPPRER